MVDCIVIRDSQTKHSRGFGFVTFSTVAEAENAMCNRPHTVSGKVVDAKRAIPREQMLTMSADNPPDFLDEEALPELKISLTGNSNKFAA